MKRITAFIGLLIVFLVSAGNIAAQELASWDIALQSVGQHKSFTAPPVMANKATMPLCAGFTVKEAPAAKSQTETQPLAKKATSPKAAPSSAAELAGKYVMTFTSAVTSGSDGGSSVTISQGSSADSILIDGFWQSGITVSAAVDFTAMTMSIPCQKIYTHATYGDMIVAVCTSEGKPDRTANVTATINDDGTISFTTWWAVFVDSGDYADRFVSANSESLLEKANGTMSQKLLTGDSAPFSYEETSYNVVLTQTGRNTLSVKNFANYGQTVSLLLNKDKSVTIESQKARDDADKGDWYTYAIAYNETTGNPTKYATNITSTAAADNRNITWTNWTLIASSSSTMYYLGVFTEGKITADFDISYPQLSVTSFDGEGTEANPYLIKTLDDLILLSDNVTENTDLSYSYKAGLYNYARVYKDKYFRMENDIDASDYRFTPVGKDWYHVFAGTFDGNNHKITNLAVKGNNLQGLFACVDSVSVIKNLTVENADVNGSGSYAAAIAAWSWGTIDNCHVTGSNISNSGVAAAGIAGSAKIITNSTVTNTTIKGLGGFAGSVAGEVTELADGCHATGMDITAGASGYPSGGLVGSVYFGKAENSYFSGIVDGSSLYVSGQYIGGVAGASYNGSISKCFSVATVTGYSVDAKVGGVVGLMKGGQLANCYSVGCVDGKSSKYTGGIAGNLQPYTDNSGNVLAQPEVSACYTSTQVSADLYLYDPENDARETIGKIDDAATPVVSNIYFNNQYTNFTSTKYGVSISTLTSATGLEGFDKSVWTFADGQYPVLNGFEETETAKYSSSALILDANSSLSKVAANVPLKTLGNTYFTLYKNGEMSPEGHYCKVSGDSLIIDEDFGTDTLLVVNGKSSYHLILKIAPIPYEGDGTELNPYLIKTKADLIKLSEVTTNAKQLFAGTYFRMANDIDMELDPSFLGISATTDATVKFSGIFDGDGHAIHNLYIYSVAWNTKPEDASDGIGTPNTSDSKGWKGFVGRLAKDGVVKNLNMASDCSFSFWATSGPFVGANSGTVDNCRNYADATGYSSIIGGIVGKNEDSGRVTNCYNAGHIISGYINAGGIAGSNTGSIENCANAGNIEVKSVSNFQKPTSNKLSRAGGIMGCGSTDCTVKNVVNAGTAYAQYSAAAGIAGALTNGANICNAINFGVAYTNDAATNGAISGEKATAASSSDNYWDVQIFPSAATGILDHEGMTGAETDSLTSGKALANFSTELWQFSSGQYPVLTQFADEQLLATARKVIVSMPSGITAKDLSADATLSTANGEAWKLAVGNAFTIEGNTLKAAAEVTTVTTDTLIATLGSYEKPIVIKRMPAIPLAGNGTENDPYLISNANEWNALVAYITATAEDLTGKFVKITADIDFSETPLLQMCADNVAYFNATMDGNNKRLSGIDLTTSATYQGVFGVIGEKGTVKNLTIAGTITSAYAYTGGFAGKLYGTLDNCVNELSVTSTRSDVAGFAGYAYTGSAFNKCINRGTISGSNTNIAGIAGSTEAGVTFTDCGNEGTVENTSTNKSYTAGIVGTSMPSTYLRCYNAGNISIKNNTAVSNVAGIVAFAKGASQSEPYVFTDCYNTADIDAQSAVAGIVAATTKTAGYSVLKMNGCYNTGNITSSATKSVSTASTAGIIALYSPGSVIENCWNSGTITSKSTYWTAGITAYHAVKATETYPVTIKNCYNTGKIMPTGKQGAGIVACCFDYVTIDSCYNTGDIEGDFGLGGIVDYFNSSTSVISNCWNSGNITTSASRAGGIFAWGKQAGRVENCFNVGDITSTNTTVGTNQTDGDAIGGICGEGGAQLVNCYNTGTVTGASRVGGIAGAAVKAKTTLSSCYNIGKIVAQADTCGALVGSSMTDNPTYWTDGNSVTDSYYVSDLYSYGSNNALGTSKTVAELAELDMGEAWTSADNYSLPMLKVFADNDAAKANSAAVVTDKNDSYASVTKTFFIGLPDGVTWTASVGTLKNDGNAADFDMDYSGDVTLTATCGDYAKQWPITLNGYTSSVNGIKTAGKNVVNAIFFTIDGKLTAKPQQKDGQVYIVVVSYDDGTSQVFKLFNK